MGVKLKGMTSIVQYILQNYLPLPFTITITFKWFRFDKRALKPIDIVKGFVAPSAKQGLLEENFKFTPIVKLSSFWGL